MQPLIAVPATLLLIYRAWSHQSLTPVGILVAALTAIAHALHPWSIFFALLVTFFLAGTAVTKVKHSYKATLTTSSSGGSTPTSPHPRSSKQVLANSLTASILILFHAFHLYYTAPPTRSQSHLLEPCLVAPHSYATKTLWDFLPYGIIAQYAAVAADTFSSELGILSPSLPILITDVVGLLSLKPRRVPRGTNGGVTTTGLAAGAGGAAVIALVSLVLTPFCSPWSLGGKLVFVVAVTLWGTLGSVLDSVLGGLLQASVVDARSGKVVEGDGGGKVVYVAKDKQQNGRKSGRVLSNGKDILSNNGVNFVMATVMALGGVIGVWAFA